MKPEMFTTSETLQQFLRLVPPMRLSRPSPEIRLLLGLIDRPVAPQPSTLAREWQVSRAAITKALGPLLAEGLVAKTITPQDKRSFTLTLTPAGAELATALAADYFQPLEHLRDGLGKKKFRKLTNLLEDANDVLIEATRSLAP
ncbi:MarR family winged helix-turn-helix transcriptional regulator [Lacticaseibacillus sp. GG6-2]